MEYILIRSKRKTLSIKISKDAELLVKAPLYLSEHIIKDYINSKKDWILEKQRMVKRFNDKKSKFSLNYGDKVLFRGKEYTIRCDFKNKIYFQDDSLYLPSNLKESDVKLFIIKLYKLLAKKHLNERVNHYKNIMRVSPKLVKVNSASTRWGSCSSKGSLNFSWKIIFAKDEQIDYVVVHELAHMKELNHSKYFWDEVRFVLPDYKQRQNQLRKIEYRLKCENWDQ